MRIKYLFEILQSIVASLEPHNRELRALLKRDNVMDILDQSMGKLARSTPGVTAVFHKYQLDFCCGGNQTVRAAARNQNIDERALLDELTQINPADTEEDCADSTNKQLIGHILSRFHEQHRQQLPELARLAARVEQVHGGNPDCPKGLSAQLQVMSNALEMHMQKEEKILFPMILQGHSHMAAQPVTVMRSEHLAHAGELTELDRLTRGNTLPKGACTTWRALYLGLETFKADLMEHIHLENNILFDRIDHLLD